eukprot:COSAG01_NODE_2029_length_8590_cov_5.719501_4_plen_259_part_00
MRGLLCGGGAAVLLTTHQAQFALEADQVPARGALSVVIAGRDVGWESPRQRLFLSRNPAPLRAAAVSAGIPLGSGCSCHEINNVGGATARWWCWTPAGGWSAAAPRPSCRPWACSEGRDQKPAAVRRPCFHLGVGPYRLRFTYVASFLAPVVFSSCIRSITTDISLCHVCFCQDIEEGGHARAGPKEGVATRSSHHRPAVGGGDEEEEAEAQEEAEVPEEAGSSDVPKGRPLAEHKLVVAEDREIGVVSRATYAQVTM